MDLSAIIVTSVLVLSNKNICSNDLFFIILSNAKK